MPSAQQRARADEPRASLLQTIRATNISNLNSLHGRGRVLFTEGEPARGVYILRTGRATVSISSSEGRVVMLRLAQAGDVLGLSSALQNCPYDTTVKTVEPCRTDFIPRHELLELMQTQAGAQAVLSELSRELSELTERAKLLLLPQTVSGRLAKLLLEWSSENGTVRRAFTHEEMAQMICTTRETVSRLLGSLSKQRVIRVTADSIVICDRGALAHIAQAT